MWSQPTCITYTIKDRAQPCIFSKNEPKTAIVCLLSNDCTFWPLFYKADNVQAVLHDVQCTQLFTRYIHAVDDVYTISFLQAVDAV